MAQNQGNQGLPGGQDNVSDVELSRVPGQKSTGGPAPNRIRVLDRETFLLHYAHLQVHRERGDPTGRCCPQTPSTLVREMEGYSPEPEVDSDTRVDEEGSGTSALDRLLAR